MLPQDQIVIQGVAFPADRGSDAESEQYRYEENLAFHGPKTLEMIRHLPSVPECLMADNPDLAPGVPLMMFALPYVTQHFNLPDRNALLSHWTNEYGIVEIMKMMAQKEKPVP